MGFATAADHSLVSPLEMQAALLLVLLLATSAFALPNPKAVFDELANKVTKRLTLADALNGTVI